MNNSRIITPCINNCKLDDEKDICCGCGRTPKEITHWIFYSNEQRSQIVQELPKRLESYSSNDQKKISC